MSSAAPFLHLSSQRFAITAALVFLLSACGSFSDTTRPAKTGEASSQATTPKTSEAQELLRQAYALLRDNDLTGAEAVLLRADRAEPRNPWVALNLGVVYQRTGRAEQARSEYRKALEADLPPVAALASDKAWQKTSPAEIARHNLKLMKPEALPNQAPPATSPQTAQAVTSPPITQTTPSKPVTAPPENELLATLEAWRSAWANRDINTYLGHYAASFSPAQGDRTSWAAERRRIIGTARTIDLGLDAPVIRLAGDDQAIVVFRQRYRSDRLEEVGTKKLVFKRISERWLIQKETYTAEIRPALRPLN